jgi:DNA/RNA-binding domain of Phe-tRNA-synthetase-like protein
MTDLRGVREVEEYLAGAGVDAAVAELRPDYRALLVAVDGLAPSDPQRVVTDPGAGAATEELLVRAEAVAADLLAVAPVEEVPHVAAWREAYRAFGAKPQRTRNSLEALLRRAGGGLPRVNLLTDAYNAVSVLHQVPLGGEDLDAYAGPPRLIRATGAETFDSVADGQAVVEHPDPGEVVWCDDKGVTCRRWNWRQGRRTRLTPETTSALFILDALAPMGDDALVAAGEDLIGLLRRLGPDVRVAKRLVTTSTHLGTTPEEHA